jgi:hypothetical protein
MAIYVDNAIFWAQIRIRGGWKNLLTITVTYACIAAFSITFFRSLAETPRSKSDVLYISSIMILGVQTVMMLLLGSASVANAIRRDVANHQIESNQLMPLSPSQAIVGYIAGAVAHLIALCIVNLLIGAVLAQLRGTSVTDWLAVNALLFLFCLSVWTAMAMAAFVSRAMFGLLFGLCSGITFSGGFIFVLVPGLLAFCTPMQGRTIFQGSSISRLTTGAVVAVVAQFLFALLCIRGAARKYVDAGAQSITLAPALATLGIWAGLSWFGMTDFLQIRPATLVRADPDWRVIVVGAVASCLLVALLPLAAVAWSNIKREQLRLAGEHAPARPWIFWICLLVCVLFAITPLSASLNEAVVQPNSYSPNSKSVGENLPVLSYGQRPSVSMIACVSAIFLVQTYFLMRLLYPRLRRANILIFFIIALTWFGPLLGDVIYFSLKDEPGNPPLDHFALLSPLGTIAQALDKPVDTSWLGVAIQGLIVLLPAMLFLFFQARARRALNPPAVAALPFISTPESINPSSS